MEMINSELNSYTHTLHKKPDIEFMYIVHSNLYAHFGTISNFLCLGI